jgi:C-terminal processing protease CtpA/Prc
MNKLVDKLSGGKVGYVHVQGMNDNSYRTVYEEVLGKHAHKEALIVDTRFNGGGWLHEDLSNFLAGKQYIKFAPYGYTAEGGEQIDPTMVFGIPMIANIGIKEKRALENFQLEPDIKVVNEYNDVLNGKDAQLEAAVKEMLKEINANK